MVIQRKTLYWGCLAQALVVCVLLFSVNAKLLQYQHAVTSPSTLSKIWLNGQKMEFQAEASYRSFLVVAWAITLAGLAVLLCRVSLFEFLFQFPIPRRVSSFQMRLHLRPPPRG